MLDKIKIVFKDKDIRKKVLFVLAILVLFRVLANIPIPGVDALRLKGFLSGSQFLGFLNIFSGGGLSKLSIIMLGISPYITGSIIMQLLTMIFPRLKEIYQEEGEMGRQKFNFYSRLITVPLAFIQGFGFMALLQREGVLLNLDFFSKMTNLIIIVAGSILIMWLGELITEYGIGNGISLLIFAGIVSGLPGAVQRLMLQFDVSQLPLYIFFLAITVAVIAVIVGITEAERPIPISYAKQIRGSKMYGGVSTHLPLRVNQSGVMPIIFAVSVLMFPQIIANFLATFQNAIAQFFAKIFVVFVTNMWVYGIFYFFLVVLFTYFYTAITFSPDELSENLQKSGAFVPGVRPGKNTAEYIGKVLNRITLVGAIFLGLIAVLPLGMQKFTGLSSLTIGGTSLLIVVAVVIELIKQIESQVVMREYE